MMRVPVTAAVVPEGAAAHAGAGRDAGALVEPLVDGLLRLGLHLRAVLGEELEVLELLPRGAHVNEQRRQHLNRHTIGGALIYR